MIAKGNPHGGGPALISYLLTGQEGERAEFISARGFEKYGPDLMNAAAKMQAFADKTTEAGFAWFHTQTRLAPGEQLTPEQWQQVFDREEKRLGFTGHARVCSFHINEQTGEMHGHAAWFRLDPETGEVRDPGLYKLRLMEVARKCEIDFGLRQLDNERQPHDKARAAERKEYEEAKRLGVDARAVRNTILNCLEQSDGGKSFKAALDERRLMLSNGDKRDCFVVIDQEGGHHALNKKLTGMTLAQLRERFADLDRSELPSVEQAKELQRERHAERTAQPEQQPEPQPGRYDALHETGQRIEAERTFDAGASRVTEPAAPVYDREAAEAAWQKELIDRAAAQAEQDARAAARGRKDDTRNSPQPEQSRPVARGTYAEFPVPEPRQPAPPAPERALSGAMADIRMAWSLSRSVSEFQEGLSAHNIKLALVSGEEAQQSQRTAAFAKEVGNFARVLKEGEIVAVNGHGNVYRLDTRTTGNSAAEIEGRLVGIDRAELLNVAAAREAMQEAARATWRAERAAEREQVRPASQLESRIADIAGQAARLGATVLEDASGRRVDRIEALADYFRPDGERQTHTVTVQGREAFAARLEEAGIAIARVTEADVTALAALREQEGFDRLSSLAHQPRHFADLLPGDLAAVTRNGDVHRINPDKCSDAKGYLDPAAALPGVVETRARFEIEGEKITALWDQQRAAGAEARQDFAAQHESHAQHAQTVRDVGQFNQEIGDAADTGVRATGRFLGGLGRLLEGFIGWIADSIAPPPPPTRDQAERMARAAEETQEARAEQTAHAERDEQHWLIIEALKRAREREETENEQESARRKTQDRGYERDR